MAIEDVAVPLIQLIALFLPAWAVVMQVFIKVVSSTDFSEEPYLIPVVSLGFVMAPVSLYLFGYAGNEVMNYLIFNELTSGNGPLASAINNVAMGALAFVSLGIVVLLTVGLSQIQYPEGIYMGILAFAFGSIIWAGWEYQRPLMMMIVLLVAITLSSFGFALYYEPDKKRIPSA